MKLVFVYIALYQLWLFKKCFTSKIGMVCYGNSG